MFAVQPKPLIMSTMAPYDVMHAGLLLHVACRGRFPVIKLSVLLAAIVAVAVKAANEKNNKKK